MKRIDFVLLSMVLFLTAFGLFMIYDASSYVAFRDFSDKYYYIKEQIVWILFGLCSLIFFSYFDYRRLYYLAVPILIAAIVLLIMVFIPGLGIKILGAHRWINLQFFVLQPAEFVKLALAIYLSAWFSTKERGRFSAFLLLMGIVLFLVMAEPDMGTATIILAESLAVFFLEGASLARLSLVIPGIVVIGFILIKLVPYRAARLAAFLKSDESLENSSYHVKQILIALGAGGWFGVGLGNSLQKYAYLPENTTDSIFAIIAEEIGFVGSAFIIILFMAVVWRGFLIAQRARDTFGKLLAGAIITFLGTQALINLGAQTALIPLTGVPLPFISYGGSALIVDLTAIGILLNISRQGIDHKNYF